MTCEYFRKEVMGSVQYDCWTRHFHYLDSWWLCASSRTFNEFSKDFQIERIFLFKCKVIRLLSKHCFLPYRAFREPLEIEESKIIHTDFNYCFLSINNILL